LRYGRRRLARRRHHVAEQPDSPEWLLSPHASPAGSRFGHDCHRKQAGPPDLSIAQIGERYVQQGLEAFENKYRERLLHNLKKTAASFGLELTQKQQLEPSVS
jgi:hypothetical protein